MALALYDPNDKKPVYMVVWHNMPHCACEHAHRTRQEAQQCAGDDKAASVVAWNRAAMEADAAIAAEVSRHELPTLEEWTREELIAELLPTQDIWTVGLRDHYRRLPLYVLRGYVTGQRIARALRTA